MTAPRVWVPLCVWLLAAAPAGAQLATFADIDTVGDVGKQSALAIGSDGLPLLAYHDATNGDLKVAHCQSVDCASSTKTVIESTGDVGHEPALAVGGDGLGIAAYFDATAGIVKVAHCADLACTSASSIVSLGPAVMARGLALAKGPDGLPLVAFSRPADGRVVLAFCQDPACHSASITPTTYIGFQPSIAIGADGRPLVATSYGQDLRLSRCLDATCAAQSSIFLLGTPAPPTGQIGNQRTYSDPSIAVGPDGMPVVSATMEFRQFGPAALAPRYFTVVARCWTPACTGLGTSPSLTERVFEPSLVLAPDGAPLIAQRESFHSIGFQNFLSVSRCVDPACEGVETRRVGDQGIGWDPAIVLGVDGIALIAFYDGRTGDLRTAYMRGWWSVDLSLAVTGTPETVVPGQVLVYDFTATNAGENAADAVRIRATLPAGVAFEAAPIGTCAYDAPTHTLECVLGGLGAGASTLAARVEVRVSPIEPGIVTLAASIESPQLDIVPSNNTAGATTTIGRWIALEPANVVEGDAGTVQAAFRAVLHDTVPAGPPATASFATSRGSATAGLDYTATSGAITFLPGAPVQMVPVQVVGDTQIEGDESFGLQLSNAQGAAIVAGAAAGTIVDDDVAAVPLAGELGHGTSLWADLAVAGSSRSGTRHYRVAQPPFTSFEVVVDAASGDAQPLELTRLGADGSTVLQAGSAPGTGASVRFGWMNPASVPSLTEFIRLRSGGCGSGCTSDDVYRIRAYDTTVRVPRFNNSGGQVTLLVLQNPSARPIGGRAWFWSASGAPAGSVSVSLASRETVVLNTATVAPGASGSISIGHDGGYGAVLGKAVALEPATGFAFDTPLELRPR
ncbi:MAG: Calx-beta domain-containing protein [Vicinamibacteria bacterium]